MFKHLLVDLKKCLLDICEFIQNYTLNVCILNQSETVGNVLIVEINIPTHLFWGVVMCPFMSTQSHAYLNNKAKPGACLSARPESWSLL